MKPMENKQTAIEWLVEKIEQANPSFKFDALIRQAKQMEKEQIKDAYKEALNDWADFSIVTKTYLADQYYNENYKSE